MYPHKKEEGELVLPLENLGDGEAPRSILKQNSCLSFISLIKRWNEGYYLILYTWSDQHGLTLIQKNHACSIFIEIILTFLSENYLIKDQNSFKNWDTTSAFKDDIIQTCLVKKQIIHSDQSMLQSMILRKKIYAIWRRRGGLHLFSYSLDTRI